MTPYSKVVQLIPYVKQYRAETESLLIALCEDGSVWWLDPSTGRFSLITEMDGPKYPRPSNSNVSAE